MRKLWLIFLVILGGVLLGGCNPLELKLKAGLQVTTGDIPATLFLDGQHLDKTPYVNKKIEPGSYILRIEPDDSAYVPYEVPINLYKGTLAVVTWNPGTSLETSGGVIYEMERLKGSEIQVEFQTVPDGAILTFDEGEKQFSPLLITDVAEGSHQFEAALPSYETQQHGIHLIKGHKVTVTVVLGKAGELPEPSPTPVETEPVAEEEEAAAGPSVQILSTNFFVGEQEVLRVRDAASPAAGELGFAVVGETYPLRGETTGWFQIDFEGKIGWVSADFSQKTPAASAQETQ